MTSETGERASMSRIPRTELDDRDRCFITHESRGAIYFSDDETPATWDSGSTGAFHGTGGTTDAGGAWWQRGPTTTTYPPHRIAEVVQESYSIHKPHVLVEIPWKAPEEGNGVPALYCRSYECRFHRDAFIPVLDSEEERDAQVADYQERVTMPNPRMVAAEDAEHDKCVGCGEIVGTLHAPGCAL